MRNIVLRNLDIIHFTQAPLFFEPGAEMSIEDVQLEDIRINAEYQPLAPRGGQVRNFIHLKPIVNQYRRKKVPGKIADISFRNVALFGTQEKGGYPVLIEGADPDHMVTNITFENVTWFGQVLKGDCPQVHSEEHTRNLRFIETASQ